MVIVRCISAKLFRSFDKFGRMEPRMKLEPGRETMYLYLGIFGHATS